MLEKIDQLKAEAEKDLEQVADSDQLEQFRIKYLGSKGAVKDLMGLLRDIPKEQKAEFGQRANQFRQSLDAAFKEKQAALSGGSSSGGGGKKKAKGPQLDITMPGHDAHMGREHILTQTIDALVDVFARMGFSVAIGPEVEDDYHNFVALNIPEEHPARDPLDNFYIDKDHLLRSQTSTVQIRVMETTPPPVRVVSIGRVYRPDPHDATHFSMFHQVEGLYVDKNVSMADLKTTLIQFAHGMFGADADVKLVPSYFPFTEPSAELYVKMDLGNGLEWIEIGGCGMVDPAVFSHVGYDPEEWTGFAFGLGIERLAMRKYNIPDIRWLFENDVRFLQQF